MRTGQRAHLESEEERLDEEPDEGSDEEVDEESVVGAGWDCLGRRYGLLDRGIISCSSLSLAFLWSHARGGCLLKSEERVSYG